VWYLSALETVFLKETERQSKAIIKRRLGKVLNGDFNQRLDRLYEMRVKSVHYGHRNRIDDEFISNADIDDARSLSYLGIIVALKFADTLIDIDAFLERIDDLT
jgi:hypothetical protein